MRKMSINNIDAASFCQKDLLIVKPNFQLKNGHLKALAELLVQVIISEMRQWCHLA